MASSAAYEYTAIEAPKTIRLLHLHPGAPTDPIHLSLVITSLDDAPDFEAISYCWGDPSKNRQQVICNDAVLHITNSLYTGLVYFRHVDRPRIIWADAICINQEDTTDKSNQVLMMPHIYSKATRTLVWLGEADDPEYGFVSPSVAESIREVYQMLPAFNFEDPADKAAKTLAVRREAQRLHEEGKPNLLDHDWTSLVALLRRPWFRRKWVIQEVVLAKEVVLYAGGGVQVPWLDLAMLSWAMEGLGIVDLNRVKYDHSILESVMIPLHCVDAILMVQQFRTSGTLVDGVTVSTFFECTDPRDHVYSLLSMGAIGSSILPDYTASVSEVYHRFAKTMLLKDQSLKVLSLAPARPHVLIRDGPRLEGLPSWVPDLRIREADILASYTVRPQAFFAGGHAKPVLSISDDERVLGCQGRLFDTVGKMTMTVVEMLVADLPELQDSSIPFGDPSLERRKQRHYRMVKDCYELAFGQSFDSDASATPDRETMRAFARAMLCDMDLARNRLPMEMIDAFPEYLGWVEHRMKVKQDENEQDPALLIGHADSIHKMMRSMPSSLRFCVTEHGRFGHVPPGCEPGDRICVLVGGEVPFVARPTGHGTYTLVGECYIEGVMDGEIFAEQEAVETEVIHFE